MSREGEPQRRRSIIIDVDRHIEQQAQLAQPVDEPEDDVSEYSGSDSASLSADDDDDDSAGYHSVIPQEVIDRAVRRGAWRFVNLARQAGSLRVGRQEGVAGDVSSVTGRPDVRPYAAALNPDIVVSALRLIADEIEGAVRHANRQNEGE